MSFAADCLDIIGECANRIRVVSTGQCTENIETLELVDPRTGLPIDLTPYMAGSSSSSDGSSSSSSAAANWCSNCPQPPDGEETFTGVQIVIKEMVSSYPYRTVNATIDSPEDAVAGIIHIPFVKALTNKAGIWYGMAVLWKEGISKKLFPFYFEVTPNYQAYNPSGPLTMAEVRLSVRDVCPEANFLIDAVDFKDNEIAWAMTRAIDYWNAVPPPIGTFTPHNFPFRYFWLNATIGELMILVGTWLRRNDLDYSAGGLTVMDTKKHDFYMARGRELLAEYKEWVLNKKIEINISGAYNMIGGYWSTPYR